MKWVTRDLLPSASIHVVVAGFGSAQPPLGRVEPIVCRPSDERGESMKFSTLACGCVGVAFGAAVLSGYAAEGPTAETVYSFEDDAVGRPPAGFTEALTAGGGPVKWQVIEQNDAPSGKRVVAQLSADADRKSVV